MTYCRLFEGKRYLSEASVRQMTSSQIGEARSPNVNDGYGFGFATLRRASDDGRAKGGFGHEQP